MAGDGGGHLVYRGAAEIPGAQGVATDWARHRRLVFRALNAVEAVLAVALLMSIPSIRFGMW